jgi:hypothetical protein
VPSQNLIQAYAHTSAIGREYRQLLCRYTAVAWEPLSIGLDPAQIDPRPVPFAALDVLLPNDAQLATCLPNGFPRDALRQRTQAALSSGSPATSRAFKKMMAFSTYLAVTRLDFFIGGSPLNRQITHPTILRTARKGEAAKVSPVTTLCVQLIQRERPR